MLVKRHVADYYNGIFTVDDLDRILRQVIIYHNKYVGVEGNLSSAPTFSLLSSCNLYQQYLGKAPCFDTS